MDNLSIVNFNLTDFNAPKIDIGIYYRSICEQMDAYFIRTGIILIILYVFIHWFNWWFFNYGYKKISYDKSDKLGKFIGDLDNLDVRIYWDNFIKVRLMRLLIGYIVVVVYINWIY